MKPFRLLLVALALMGANGPGEGDWRLRLPITPAPGAKVQRVELPARAILALQRADGGDVRVLDAEGRAQPLARLPTPVAPSRTVPLTPLPILGASNALKVTGVTLKVEEGQAKVVRVDGQPSGATGGQELLGVLLDTRKIDAPVSAIALDVDAPASQPVTFTLESSDTLKDWRPEGEGVLFRAGGNAPLVVKQLDGDWRGRMLRVTWRADGRLLSPVTVKGATVSLAASPDAARVSVRAALPPVKQKRIVEFTMPMAVSPAALRVVAGNGGYDTGITVSGRDNREQQWDEVGSAGLVTTPDTGGPKLIEIARPYREWLVEISANSAPFDGQPGIDLRFAPVAIAFLAAGPGPYTLAVGKADAGPSFAPFDRFDGQGAVGQASVSAAPPPVLALPPIEAGVSRKTWLLWGALLLGVAVLAAMAWALMRGERAAPPATPGTAQAG